MKKTPKKIINKAISVIIVAFLTFSLILPPAYAQELLGLPAPGTMVTMSEAFTPLLLRGIIIDVDNPFHFDFIIDTGNHNLDNKGIAEESKKVIKYFLASLTVPEDELWVNLSPYENDRIIPQKFGETEMGRDLLAQDYFLKQLTASLLYPENDLGENFWRTVYAKAFELYGKTDIPVDTYNKVWIMPESAVIYENQDTAYVQESHLKVMLEEDYLALSHNIKETDTDAKAKSSLSSKIIREILIPEIEREVNQGKSFVQLRQIYNSLIVAAWFKENLKETIISKDYVDKNKVIGVDVADKDIKTKIYGRYLEAFKEGVYSYIREDYDPATKTIIPRKYFSGGMKFGKNLYKKTTKKPLNEQSPGFIKKTVNGLIVLVTALLFGSDVVHAGIEKISQLNPDKIISVPLERVNAEIFFPDPRSSEFVYVKPLTEEEKKILIRRQKRGLKRIWVIFAIMNSRLETRLSLQG